MEHDIACGVTMPHAHRLYAVTMHVGGHGGVLAQDAQLPAVYVGGEHRFDHGQCDARFAANARHPAVAGIETDVRPGPRGERGLRAIVIAHAGAQRQVTAGTSDGFDPRILVGRHRLLGELSADPIGLLGHDHPEPTPRGGQRGGTAAEAAANDHEIGGQFTGHAGGVATGPRAPGWSKTPGDGQHHWRGHGQSLEKVASAHVAGRLAVTGHVLAGACADAVMNGFGTTASGVRPGQSSAGVYAVSRWTGDFEGSRRPGCRRGRIAGAQSAPGSAAAAPFRTPGRGTGR